MYGRLLRCRPSTSYATVVCRQSNYVISPTTKHQYTTSSKLERYDRRRTPSSIGFHQSTGGVHQLLGGAFALRSDTCSRRHLSMQPSAQWILDRLIGGAGGNAVSATLGASEAQTASSSSSNVMADTFGDVGLIPDVPALPAPAELADLIQASIADLGLMSYWPPGWVQWIINHAHVDLGVPWWQAIAIMMFVMRTLIIPVNVSMRRYMHKAQKFQPRMQELQQQLQTAQDSQSRYDQMEGQFAQMELQELTKKAKLKPLKPLFLMGCQGLLMISCFTALRGFCKTEDLLGFDVGGILWFTDLTGYGDEWFDGWSFAILPLLNGITVFTAMRTGIEMGNAAGAMQKWAPAVFSVVGAGAAWYMPTALGYYWVISNCYTMVLSQLFKMKSTQKVLGLPPPPKPLERPSLTPLQFWKRSGSKGSTSLADIRKRDKQAYEKVGMRKGKK